MIKGSIVAIVTPMHEDGSLDLAAFRALIDFHIAQGTDAVVVVGTTGESPTVDVEEHESLIQVAVEHAAGRIPVIAGTGANSTKEAIELASFSKRAGANASLTVVPYYNKPTQEGLYLHFKAIAEAVDKPLILYNVPGRTGANLEPATLGRLAQVKNIAGVKEASGNLSQIADVFNAVPDDFLVFSGDDAVTLPVIALGGAGVISVASNEIPKEMAEMTRAALANDWATARQLHRKYLALMQANFIESNPIPVKAVLAMMGRIEENYRLPLVPMKKENRAKLEKIAQDAGLLKKAAAGF